MIIVYNSFRKYLKEMVKKKFHESDIDLAVILDSLTSIYQPLEFIYCYLKIISVRNGIFKWQMMVLVKLLLETCDMLS